MLLKSKRGFKDTGKAGGCGEDVVGRGGQVDPSRRSNGIC